MKRTADFRRTAGGSVLILAVWVLFFLAALAVAVGSHVSGLLATADYVGVRETTSAAARAGAMLAAYTAAGRTNAWDGLQAGSWTRDDARFADLRLGDCSLQVAFLVTSEDGRCATNTGLLGEEARINLNRAATNVLAAYVVLAGGKDERAARAIAGAIVDWRDPDDEVLTGDAESVYHSRLSPSYRAANKEIRVLEELLLVRGVDARLFDRLAPGLTVHGSGHVNLNAASRVVLESLGRACAGTAAQAAAAGSLAAKIVAFREDGNVFRELDSGALRSQLEAARPLSPEESSLFSAMMGKLTIRSTCYRGVAMTRRAAAAATQATVAFVFDRDKREFVEWQER